MSATDLISIEGKWNFAYTYFAGESASRFFHELKDKRIMGTRCSKCRRLLVPARAFCDACMERTTEWEAVGPKGKLETFTIITAKFPGLPDPPIALIRDSRVAILFSCVLIASSCSGSTGSIT